jgi:hypothetical protein
VLSGLVTGVRTANDVFHKMHESVQSHGSYIRQLKSQGNRDSDDNHVRHSTVSAYLVMIWAYVDCS